jgi:Nitroreductase family
MSQRDGRDNLDRATVDHLLTTTRTVRKRLDLTRPVEREVIQECLEIAIQAPNGGNQNRYHFVVVTDPAKRVRPSVPSTRGCFTTSTCRCPARAR